MITPKEFIEKYKVEEKDLDELITFLDEHMNDELMLTKDVQSQLLTTKDTDGHYRWTLFTGSAFEDRDGEIVSEKAFQDDCDQMELTGDYGELLWWHCDGTQHATDKEARPYIPLGKCDISFVDNKINIESGTYYNDDVGKVLNEQAKEFGASKSFWHKEDAPVENVYDYIRTKERSIMPRTKESNLLTRLFGQKEKEMADNKERIAALKEKLGEEETNKILAQGKEMSEKAEKFLQSKEKKDKKDVKSEETDEEETDTMKEFEAKLELATKEAETKYTLALKEQKDTFDKEVLTLKEVAEKQAADIAQLQGGLATLLGFQPKGANKFVASESKTTVKKELTAEEKQKEKEALGFGGDVTSWIFTGERPVAA